MKALRLRWKLVLTVLVIGSLAASAPASAQTGDSWSFLVTPQLWFTHIEKNGFAPPASGSSGTVVFSNGQIIDANPLGAKNAEPVNWGYPQWGVQLAAQKGRLTLAGAFQRVDFETRTDIISAFQGNTSPLICNVGIFTCSSAALVRPGQFLGRERLSSERMDIDVAASYLFPDVVPQALDFSIGIGAKAIYAEATRRYENLGVELSFENFFLGGLYTVCVKDSVNLVGCPKRDVVHTTDWIYGLTIPTNTTVHLGPSLLLPINITPFVGVESRDDHDVVYRLKQVGPTSVKPVRLDGTTVAYGVTADLLLRYLINDDLSVYAGGRVQYIKGHEQFLAYGPIVGMTVRFGGK
jgi:hypothetical protein